MMWVISRLIDTDHSNGNGDDVLLMCHLMWGLMSGKEAVSKDSLLTTADCT